ncbi:hypothetical protein RJ639_001336 [Escallonia herrerae]|uniref:Epidermal patterning factor-like protein n=1 Tax=Escallonia herrerae TaxID=1293975 RepID=A0AA88X8W8_9ASTE|nr:hypothetical protein RJ639_001336 [Escallonia herrerae]
MGVPLSHHRRRPRSLATITALAFLILASSASATTLNPSPHLGEEAKRGGRSPSEVVGERAAAMTRRRLGGPGSSPPTCRSKCGRCSPCRPVQVPIQPGLSIPLEYYPEAWRCKCGSKLFMP